MLVPKFFLPLFIILCKENQELFENKKLLKFLNSLSELIHNVFIIGQSDSILSSFSSPHNKIVNLPPPQHACT